jgi:hypothetical protein
VTRGGNVFLEFSPAFGVDGGNSVLKQKCLGIAVAVASVFGASLVEAAPIVYPLEPGRIVGSVIFDQSLNVLGYDVSVVPKDGDSSTGLGLFDGVTPLGVSLAIDNTAGLADFLILTPDASEFAVISFDFLNGIFDNSVSPALWVLPGTGTAAGSTPLTNPLLLALQGPLTAQLHFSQLLVNQDNTFTSVFVLDSIKPVPEPAALSLTGLGLFVAARVARRRSTRGN